VESSFESHRDRRGLLASDVSAYEHGRPDYPERVYELLTEVCGLRPGTRVLEVGPGTGQATRPLLERGASVTAVELGAELADRLTVKFPDADLTVEIGAFEDTVMPAGSFDLVAAATSFHWVPTEAGLHRSADALRRGGWLALWWSHFGDPDRPDPFHEALLPILGELAPSVLEVASAGNPSTSHPYALDAAARVAEIDATGRFGPVQHEVAAWTGSHTAEQLRAMFASFSPWLALPPTERGVALDALERLAIDEFRGVVERPYLTAIYLAQAVPQT